MPRIDRTSICLICECVGCPIDKMEKVRDSRSCPDYKKYYMFTKDIVRTLHIGLRTFMKKTNAQKIKVCKERGYKLIISEDGKRNFYRIEKIDSPE